MPEMTRADDEHNVRERSGRTETASDSVVERAKVREVAGVLPSRIALDAAVESLLHAGFDRADIDVLDTLEPVRERLGTTEVVAEEIADLPHAPRRPYFAPEDIISTEVVVASVAASVGAIAAAFVVVSSGGGLGWAMIAAAGAALIAGGAAFLLMMLFFRQPDETEALEALTAPRGFVLWVRVRMPEQEDAAKHILIGYGAQAVRLHEIEIVKRQDDIPLSSLRPDPWLGDERMSDP
jgi:hypothetical protein